MFSYKNSLALLAFFYMCYCWCVHEADNPRGFNYIDSSMSALDEAYEKSMRSMANVHIPVYDYEQDASGRLEVKEITKRFTPESTPTPAPKKPKEERKPRPIVIVVPTPVPTPVATPKPTPKPKPKPKPLATPKPTPTPAPEPVFEEMPMPDGMDELILQDREFLENNKQSGEGDK